MILAELERGRAMRWSSRPGLFAITSFASILGCTAASSDVSEIQETSDLSATGDLGETGTSGDLGETGTNGDTTAGGEDGGPTTGDPICGDGVVEGDEACDDGNASDQDACTTACEINTCGDGVLNPRAEACDDNNTVDGDGCSAACVLETCGDGVVQAEEACDDGNDLDTDNCTNMCATPTCGDGIVWAGVEACDDGNSVDIDACVACVAATCGDGLVEKAKEQCDDGNGVDGDGCSATCVLENPECQAGSVQLSLSPGGDAMVCDDPLNTTCEQDLESLCPVGWGLCSRLQHINRNTGWDFAVGNNPNVVVGEIYCRGTSGAGHYTLGPYDGVTNLDQDAPLNCGFGSSRESCTSDFGCNERHARALCCAPTFGCGNGVVDGVEEECDDGNSEEDDACLDSCTWRVPTQHGLSGTSCVQPR